MADKKKKKKLTIKRSLWYRGKGGCGSFLMRSNGEMCCLGFAARQLGKVPEEDILGKSTPSDLLDEHRNWETDQLNPDEIRLHRQLSSGGLGFLYKKDLDNSNVCEGLMHSNDDHLLNEKEREEKIRDSFKRQGIEVEFVD